MMASGDKQRVLVLRPPSPAAPERPQVLGAGL